MLKGSLGRYSMFCIFFHFLSASRLVVLFFIEWFIFVKVILAMSFIL